MAPCIYYGNAVVYGLMQTVVETPPYLADAERLLARMNALSSWIPSPMIRDAVS